MDTASERFLDKVEKHLQELGSHPQITHEERAIVEEYANLDFGAEPCALHIVEQRNAPESHKR